MHNTLILIPLAILDIILFTWLVYFSFSNTAQCQQIALMIEAVMSHGYASRILKFEVFTIHIQ